MTKIDFHAFKRICREIRADIPNQLAKKLADG